MVIAVPRRPRADALDEEVLVDEVLEHAGGLHAGQGLGELGREPVDDRGLQQETPCLLGLPAKRLLHEVVHGGAVVEQGVDRSRGRPTLRQGEQPEPCGPPLGPVEQNLEDRRWELDLERVEERARLVSGEGEIGGTKLDQLAARPEDVDGQVGIVARGDDQPELRGLGS